MAGPTFRLSSALTTSCGTYRRTGSLAQRVVQLHFMGIGRTLGVDIQVDILSNGSLSIGLPNGSVYVSPIAL